MNKKMIKDFKPYVSYFDNNIGEVIKKLNQSNLSLKFQIIIDNTLEVLGTITDGDIRRGILKNFSLDSQITEIMNKDFVLGNMNDDDQNNIKLEKLNLLEKAPFLPIVDDKNILNSILTMYDLPHHNTSALIMAGGFGKRLGSYTENIPKPLVEVAGKPIIQYVLDKVFLSSIENINISLLLSCSCILFSLVTFDFIRYKSIYDFYIFII